MAARRYEFVAFDECQLFRMADDEGLFFKSLNDINIKTLNCVTLRH